MQSVKKQIVDYLVEIEKNGEDLCDYGVRIQEENVAVGDHLENSYRWKNGECLHDEPLRGTCCVSAYDIIHNYAYNVLNYYKWANRSQVIVVRGEFEEWGEDNHESIISNAKVAAVFSRE